MSDLSDRELLDALGVETESEKQSSRSASEERIIAGFDEIQRFIEQYGRAPQHGEGNDIFERIYAVRLDRLRQLEECRSLLQPLDQHGLLASEYKPASSQPGELEDSALLSELGVSATPVAITELKHVRSSEEKRAAEEIANRQKCEDFDRFKPLFQKIQKELDAGVRQTRAFEVKSEIKAGAWFIVGGQKAYVAEMGEVFTNPNGMTDARLRVIFDNGTESNLLMRSLQRALHKDEAGRRISDPNAGPLFSGQAADDDTASGKIYVLRSKSDHPVVSKNRDVVHKIGVTGSDVKKRIANAKLDPTFLMADVEIVATYELYNINRTKLENLIHRFFEPARLDVEIKDRFGQPVVPREWFLVPRFAVDQAVEKIKDGTIGEYYYDKSQAALVKRQN